MQERQLSLSLLRSYLPLSRNLVQAITPVLFEVGMSCTGVNSYFLRYVVIYPEAKILCAP